MTLREYMTQFDTGARFRCAGCGRNAAFEAGMLCVECAENKPISLESLDDVEADEYA